MAGLLSSLALATVLVRFIDTGIRQVSQSQAELDSHGDSASDIAELRILIQAVNEAAESLKGKDAATGNFSAVIDDCNDIATSLQDLLAENEEVRNGGFSGKINGKGKLPLKLLLSGTRRRADAVRKRQELEARLRDIRSKVAVVFQYCLWIDSKQKKDADVIFSNQLESITEILKRIEASNQESNSTSSDHSPAHQALEPIFDQIGSLLATDPNFDEAGTKSLSILMEASRTGRLDSVSDALLPARGNRIHDIRIINGLIKVMWRPNWEPDPSILGEPSADELDKALFGVRFEEQGFRESGVSQTFENTYSWVFQRKPRLNNETQMPMWSSFPDWLESPSTPSFWITGRPGSGKSTMMKYILQHDCLDQHLQEWAGDLPFLVTTFYAWNAGIPLQKSLEGFQRTVLVQATELRPNLLPILFPRRVALYRIIQSNFVPPPADWELAEAFNALLAQCGKELRLVIFIDGLDEFDMPPREIVEWIDAITDGSKAADGIKVCISSRPWIEFVDAYRDAPKLEMHLLTANDMTLFVTQKFDACRAFIDIRQTFPKKATELLDDVVQRSNGIFIWVSLVVDTLTEAATEGSSVGELRRLLETLPDDLRSLYDAIWDRIPPNSRSSGSAMIQLFDATTAPRPLLLWLADECLPRTGSSPDFSVEDLSDESFPWILHSLDRKLASRTRGILEMNRDVVSFTHRSAADWTREPDVMKRIASACNIKFDPDMVIIQAATLLMAVPGSLHTAAPERRLTIGQALVCASRVAERSSDDELLVQRLDKFNQTAAKAVHKEEGGSATVMGKGWPAEYVSFWQSQNRMFRRPDARALSPSLFVNQNVSFFGLATLAAILPYVRAKIGLPENVQELLQRGTENRLGILESAIFGPGFWMAAGPFGSFGRLLDVSLDLRLATVQLLLNHGAVPAKYVFCETDVERRTLKAQIQLSASRGSVIEREYYESVLKCLESRPTQHKLKSASIRMRSLLGM